MRITTQMLANSAAKSGIPIQRTSLLDIINNKSSQNLLGTIGKSTNTTRSSATDILRKNNYAKLEELSEKLDQSAEKLVGTDKDSIYDKAKESGDTTDILSDAKKMVEAYNATMKQLKTTGGTMNEFYLKQLKDIPFVPENRAWHEANNTYIFSYGLGALIMSIGILVFLGIFFPKVGLIGDTLAIIMTLGTLSFLVTTPEVWVPNLGSGEFGFPLLSGAGRLVIKDIVILASAVVLLSDSSQRVLKIIKKD